MKTVINFSFVMALCGLMLVAASAIAQKERAEQQRKVERIMKFDNVQGYRPYARARCSTDTECMEMFGGDGSPTPAGELQ